MASSPTLLPITEIARNSSIPEQYLIPYGHEVAKVDLKVIQPDSKQGKLVLVSAITPTPLGEGKTVTTIGLSQGLNFIGKKAIACIRQPSLGPVFGVKGGAAGGGKAQVLPMEKLNLHLTGDIHAITAAHDLASAALDARLYHEEHLGEEFTAQTKLPRLNIDKNRIVWKRVIDHNDRALRRIKVGVGGGVNGVEREDGFEISAASELMAILALATDLQDMRQRIGRIILAYDTQGNPVTAEKLQVAGAMTVLLKDAINPNLMQTAEQTPVLIHAGPFANIAHGNSSVLADMVGLQVADYVVTEAGFGSDMGMEKFFNIKYRQTGVAPSCVVLVATVRSLKSNSGRFNIKPGQPLPAEVTQCNVELLAEGSANLGWHIQNAKSYGLPVIVAINRFPYDHQEELDFVRQYALEHGAYACEISDAFTQGGAGTQALAQHVVAACNQENSVTLPYADNMPLPEKIQTMVKKYGARQANLSAQALQNIEEIKQLKLDHLPLCMVKTPLSISADPNLKNVPTDFDVEIARLQVSAGAGFIRVYAGNVMTMPGLGTLPAYQQIDIDAEGNIVGLH
ncbi:formate--tetrahydrofolate ligase [Snodgrassella alvi]|uniref:formate--tetrahydrofolate ligase n=1 Tax=Snodgrassella alvi TaxID=1196083 RepID=UPI0009FBCA3F|nr:formate--tetrahydrofolate ligase [Snodgrassella alvi]ORF26496.1 formate--tetrahydrofolate ligase [Snodgrassella alvi]ORF34158.1 formate--tetrahydrofolate ligase [Snodgrassella alvi]ORF34714.1 formate--tetrahydrofolate ligase [Snodgrassella alvi]ORF38044.1 formate--tetrahydrofolate ligase [Snodgrassella alvi]ORF39584.1 formate--tetrahydrofolate ligase [Snodgrassella alvi]